MCETYNNMGRHRPWHAPSQNIDESAVVWPVSVIRTEVNHRSSGPHHDEAADYTGVNHEDYHSQRGYRPLIHASTAITREKHQNKLLPSPDPHVHCYEEGEQQKNTRTHSYRPLMNTSTAITTENSTKYQKALPTSSCASGMRVSSAIMVEAGTRGLYSLRRIWMDLCIGTGLWVPHSNSRPLWVIIRVICGLCA